MDFVKKSYTKIEGTGIGSYKDVEFYTEDERFTIRSKEDAIKNKESQIEEMKKEVEIYLDIKAKEREFVLEEIRGFKKDISSVEKEAKKTESKTKHKTINQKINGEKE